MELSVFTEDVPLMEISAFTEDVPLMEISAFTEDLPLMEISAFTEEVLLMEFMYLVFTWQLRAAVGDSGLCCACVTYFKR